MMTKKKINIVLIIVVLGLWGTVAYKTVSQYFFSKELIANKTHSNNELNSNQINKDTFQLEKITRDPFLNTLIQSADSIPKKHYSMTAIVKTNTIAIKPKVVITWPFISYHGYIKSKEKNEALVLVKIDKKLYKVRKDEQIEGVTIKKVYSDSIELSFNTEKKTIKLN